jgi:hypothetical protein
MLGAINHLMKLCEREKYIYKIVRKADSKLIDTFNNQYALSDFLKENRIYKNKAAFDIVRQTIGAGGVIQ